MSVDTIDKPDDRYRYTEFELYDETIAMIEDRENRHAWVQSTETRRVHR